MYLRRFQFTLIGLVIATCFLHAQSAFKPGFVILTTNDTLFGMIEYRGDSQMDGVCRFKNAADKTVEYSPHELTAFSFTNLRYYVSKEINGKMIFLECLIKGKLSIYYLCDHLVDHYYLEKDGEKLTALTLKEGTKIVHNKRKYYESAAFKGILYYYTQEVPDLKSRITAMDKPEHQNLIELAKEYHQALSGDENYIIYDKDEPGINVSLEPFAGVTKYVNLDNPTTELGCNVFIWAPRASENLYLKSGLAYQYIRLDYDSLLIFKIPLQVQYLRSSHKFEPKFSVGINFFVIRTEHYKSLAHTLSFNAGFNYKLSGSVSLCANVNTDFIPYGIVLISHSIKYPMVSYSINCGLCIKIKSSG